MNISKYHSVFEAAYLSLIKCVILFLSLILVFGEVKASSFSHHEENIQFKNGGVMLRGTLILPDTPGPHPAIVVVHGSGPSDRHNWEEHTKHFPSHGIAILKFDKRGVGASTGNWLLASSVTLADDVLAGVNYLTQRQDINSNEVGI